MILTEKVPVIEVKRNFLLADFFKDIAEQHRKLSKDELEKRYEQLREKLGKLEEYHLNEGITDKVRLDRYNSMDWYKGNKEFSEMGVWPKMRAIDISLTIGSVLDTAKGVKEVIENKSDLNVPERFREKLASMRELSEFIYSRFPLILFPGGEIREKDYNRAKENNEPLCSIFNHDIDDGSGRSVAYALEGLENAVVYFGKKN